LISDLIIYDPHGEHKGPSGVLRLAKELRQQHFDLAIHLLPRFSLAISTYLAQITYSIGTGFRWYSFLFTHRHYEHRKHNVYHEADYNLRILGRTGISPQYHSDVFNHFNFSAASSESVQKIIRDKFGKRPFIIIHPGSGGSSIDWSLDSFIKLIRLLNKWGKFEVGITGISGERKFLASLFEADIRCQDLVGLLDLNNLAILLCHASLYISNSTGPLHLAVAMGTPVLGFYPNAPGLGPGRWGPYGRPDSEIMIPQVHQERDIKEGLHLDMNRITPDQVLDRIQNRLG
jgi:ADP-heptose:LPS heptosyltransferase